MCFIRPYEQSCIGQEDLVLEDISIKDFVLIDSLSLDFSKGLTVFSGETGAGKSILIGAISFLLGGKGGVELVRDGASEARVSGSLYISPEHIEARQWLSEHHIELDENRLLLRRVLRSNGKSASWIQEAQVTKAEVQEFTALLVDIHGQHEHQSLMRPSEHRKFLDAYAGIENKVRDFTQLYTDLITKRQKMQAVQTSDAERKRKIEMLVFACEEIEALHIRVNEETELEEELSRLSQFEKLYETIQDMNQTLSTGDSALVSHLKKLHVSASHIEDLDKVLATLSQRLESAFYEVSDIANELNAYQQSLIFDPSRLEEVQDRLAQFFRLKKKYLKNQNEKADALLDFLKKAEKELLDLQNWEEDRELLEKEIKDLEKKLYDAAVFLTEKRRAFSEKMSEQLVIILQDLGMKNTLFQVSISEKESTEFIQKCGPYGKDNIEFLIAANEGSVLRPLSKIASGGEISRVMLALKTIFSATDAIESLIFDEIDTGIGGEIAVSVGKHLKALSKKKQVFCITHLASIAVFADTHMRIEKKTDKGATFTSVVPIMGEDRVEEIARMLSGDAFSQASIDHARSLLAMS